MSTVELSHRGMFLNRASVRRHITTTNMKPCHDSNLGTREIQVEARAGDVMAGGGGEAGPAPDVRHQPAGDVHEEIPTNILIPCRKLLEYAHSWSSSIDSLAVCIKFRDRIPRSCTFKKNVFYDVYFYIPSMFCIYLGYARSFMVCQDSLT